MANFPNLSVTKLQPTDLLLVSRVGTGQVVSPDVVTSYVGARIISAAKDTWPNSAATNVPRGVVGTGSITGGSGGATGTFALAFTGGNFAVNPTGTFTVAGGEVTSISFATPGEYIGASPTAPTLSFAASAGLTGVSATATVGFLIANGMRYWTRSADGLSLVQYQNLSGVATAVTPAVTLATSEGVAAGSAASAASASAASASATLAGNNATTALLAYAQAEAAKYGITLGPDIGAIWDIQYWRTDWYQDDGVNRATQAGHAFGMWKNRLGIASLDLIELDPAKKGALENFMGILYPAGGPGTGLRLRGNQTLKIPFFQLCAARITSESINPFFGIIKNTGDQALMAADTSGRVRGSFIGTSPSRPWTIPTTEPYSRPPKTAAVYHSHMRAGYVDVRVNDDVEDPSYSPKAVAWADGDTVTDMSGGVNAVSQSGGIALYDGTKSWAFFGGCFLPGIKEFDRAALVAYFMASMEPEIRSGDEVILFVTDSQADDVDRNAGDFGAHPTQPGPVPLWILNHLGPNNATASILYRKASWKGNFLTGWRAEQVVASDIRKFVINLTVAGSQPNFFLGDKFIKMIGGLHHVDRVIIAHGGNMNHSVPDATGHMKVGEYKMLTDAIWERYPDADIRYLDPYPFAAALPDTIAPVRASCALGAGDYGLPVSNTYGEWFTAGRPSSRYFADNAHLSYGVGSTFGIVVRATDIQNLYAAAASGAKGQTSLSLVSTQGATWGFDQFEGYNGGTPTGWTFTGGGTAAKSTKRIDSDRGSKYSVRLQQSSGWSYLEKVIDATPFRGQPFTALMRVNHSGTAHFTEARLQMFSNGTGAVSASSWINDTSAKGGEKFRDVYLSLPTVPMDATQITIRPTCGNGGAADVSLDGIAWTTGRNPKYPR